MALISFSIKVQGQEKIKHRFNKVVYGLEDNSPWLKRLADREIYPKIDEVFNLEGIPRWATLTPGYATRKAKLFPGAKILQATGALRKSLTSKGGRGSIYKLTKDRLEIGTSLSVGRWNLGLLHQEGRGRLPERQIFSTQVLNHIDKRMLLTAQNYLREKING